MSIKLSRTALVAFFNDTLRLNITKVDDLGDGAGYCQLLDSIYGDLPMHRVTFDSRAPLDMETNYKVLQQAFLKHQINRNFDSTKLMKCRLQDNLDFSQWLYQFWHESPHIEGYDPMSRRLSGRSTNKVKRAPSVMLASKKTAAPQPQVGATPSGGSMSKPAGQNWQRPVQAPDSTFSKTPLRPASSHVSDNASLSPHAAAQRIASLEEEVDELGKSVDVLMEERGLYYEKLLDIEQLMNHQIDKFYSTQGNAAAMEHATDPMLLLIRQIQEILFSSPEGFQPQLRPEDEPF